MATVFGTDGNDFIHLAGDGRTAPPGYTDVTFNPGDLIAALSGDDILIGTAAGNRFGGYDGYDILDYSDFTQGVVISELDGGIRFLDGTLIGTIAASAGLEEFQGTAFNDILATTAGGSAVTLHGNGGNDTLIANSNVELLDGGADNDTVSYTNSTAGVTVDLNLGVQVSGGHAGGDTLVGIENVTGSAFADSLTGDAGNNVLVGLDGADTLIGGLGSDTADYTASTAGVIVSLEAGSGTGGHAEGDVLTSIENLTGSAFADTLTGTDAGANRLAGGAGNDLLDGLGGNDTLIGGLGDDIFIVSSIGDRVIEVAGEGRDTIRSSVDWTIGVNVERLELRGSGNLTGNGNGFDNTVGGNSGNNILRGGNGVDTIAGYLGNDRLVGGEGRDTFVFNSVLGPDNIDTITDYTVADDMILLENGIFAGLVEGMLAATAFHIGAAAHDATDRLIYNTTTGGLFFDKDGLGGIDAIQFATVTPGLAMTANEFFVA